MTNGCFACPRLKHALTDQPGLPCSHKRRVAHLGPNHVHSAKRSDGFLEVIPFDVPSMQRTRLLEAFDQRLKRS